MLEIGLMNSNVCSKDLKGKAFIARRLRLAWSVCIYFVWLERNRRLHDVKASSSSMLLNHIKEVVRCRLESLKKDCRLRFTRLGIRGTHVCIVFVFTLDVITRYFAIISSLYIPY